MGEKIDVKYLEGLTYSGADVKIIKVDGKDKEKSIPFTRPATPADVMDWKDKGDVVVIVMNDGMKYEIEKESGKAVARKKKGR